MHGAGSRAEFGSYLTWGESSLVKCSYLLVLLLG
ncbi:hypothetical protein ABIB56_001313 [Glaciihabitans sp. UYNi722]